jgi:hypothetical protein
LFVPISSDNFRKGMTSVDAPSGRRSLFTNGTSFVLHTLLVYLCALHLSGWLVSRWFALVAPVLQISSIVRPEDWYLQHLEVVTVVPAFVAGYLNVFRSAPVWIGGTKVGNHPVPVGVWAWIVPATILCYKMLAYRTPSSVLYGRSVYETFIQAVRYFFVIQQEAPRLWNLSASDPVRVLEQMTITAPFYAGMSYSLGALETNYYILTKLFTFQTPRDPEPDSSGTHE